MLNRLQITALLALLLLLQACSQTEISSEARLKQIVEQAISAAESRSHDDLMEWVSRDFRGRQGIDRKRVSRLIRVYLFRHKNIHLFSKLDSIEFSSETDAIIRLHVAMAGSAISDSSVLASLRARIYRFELEMVNDGNEWMVKQANWWPAGISDME
jgi:hypothetical protein